MPPCRCPLAGCFLLSVSFLVFPSAECPPLRLLFIEHPSRCFSVDDLLPYVPRAGCPSPEKLLIPGVLQQIASFRVVPFLVFSPEECTLPGFSCKELPSRCPRADNILPGDSPQQSCLYTLPDVLRKVVTSKFLSADSLYSGASMLPVVPPQQSASPYQSACFQVSPYR